MGGSTLGILKSVEVAEECENVYLETDNYNHPFGVIEYLVDRLGPTRILFGSDMATEPQSLHMGAILYARISDEDKRRILGENMAALLREMGFQL